MRIFFIIPYPLKEAPSQRFRFEQYFTLLEKAGHHYQTQSFLSTKNWKLFFRPGQPVKKMAALIKGYLKRISVLWVSTKFDLIFIHREAAPLGPPVFEWILSRVLHKKIIYDFDDAIWLTDKKNESQFLQSLKWRNKVATICKWSYKISCGNEYLRQFAQQHNKQAFLNPTTIDIENLHRLYKHEKIVNKKVIIGWTGSHSTIKYLNDIEPILQVLENEYPQLEYWIIADKPTTLKLKSLHFKKWSLETEIADLSQFDIGIMPLPDDEWARGKCGFKALQYMALEIPTVASPVGVNTSIIDHGINGFLCSDEGEWLKVLSLLIQDELKRKQIGKKGREKVLKSYSVESNTVNFLSLFS